MTVVLTGCLTSHPETKQETQLKKLSSPLSDMVIKYAILVYLGMKPNKYIRQLISTYSEGPKRYSIIAILEDLEKYGVNSNLGYFIIMKTYERLVQKGVDPYDRKNKNKVYETLLDVIYEETDLEDQVKALGLNTSYVNEELLEKVPPIIQRNFEFIMKVLKRKGDTKISSIIKDISPELAQWRRTYSSSARDFLRKLQLGFATMGLLFQTKAANLPVNPNPQSGSKHQIESVKYPYDISIILKDLEHKVDIISLRDCFSKFYTTLGVSPVPKSEGLLKNLYNRAVFYTQHIKEFNYKFGNSQSMYNTLLRYDNNDVYVATLRDLFITSVAGGALEQTWNMMNRQNFTDTEINAIKLALSNHTYTVQFHHVSSNATTTNFSNVITIKVPLENNQLAELTLKIEGLSTFNYENLKITSGNIAKGLQNNFVTVHKENDITNTYGFYMIVPNGIETTTNQIHYLGIVFKVVVKAYKVSNEAVSDGTSSTMGIANLKNKYSRMFRKRKKYEWM